MTYFILFKYKSGLTKNIITRNIHVKKDNSGTHCSKVINKLKARVFETLSKLKSSRSEGTCKKRWYRRKVMPQGISMSNIKALTIAVQKL